MYRSFARSLLLAALCTLLASAAAAAAAPGRPAEAFVDGLLWKASRKGAPDNYIFGTPVLGDARLDEVPPAVLEALARSRSFARATDWSRFTASRAFALARFRDGTTLRGLLGDADHALLVPIAASRGIDAAVLDRMPPWAALLAIVPPIPRDPIVEGLADAAAKRRMKLVPLELPNDQVAALASVPREAQVALLRHAIEHRERYAELADGLAKAWESRNLKAIDAAADRFAQVHTGVSGEYRRAVRAVTGNSVVQMKHRLTLALRAGGVFVAVSALHLHGQRGLLALLAQDGYRIESVW